MSFAIEAQVETGHLRYLKNQHQKNEEEAFQNEISSLKKRNRRFEKGTPNKESNSHKKTSYVISNHQYYLCLSKPSPQENSNNDSKNKEGFSEELGTHSSRSK